MKKIKKFNDFLNEENGSFTIVDYNAKEKWFGLNSDWHKNNLPFKFKSPISNEEYNISSGNVRMSLNYGKSVYNLSLYEPWKNIFIKKDNIYNDDDVIIIEEGAKNIVKKSFYMKNLEEKDILYKIISDIKSEIENN
jgi:hypothetical protein